MNTCYIHGANLRPERCADCARIPAVSVKLTPADTNRLVRIIDDSGRVAFRLVDGPIPTPERLALPWAQIWD